MVLNSPASALLAILIVFAGVVVVQSQTAPALRAGTSVKSTIKKVKCKTSLLRWETISARN